MVVVGLGAGLLAGCGTSPPVIPGAGSVAERTAGFSSDNECSSERVVLELALAAHAFETGAPTASEADLVKAQWIDREVEGVAVVDGVVVPVAEERCGEPLAAAAQLPPECFNAVFRLVVATEMYQARTGAAPQALADLHAVGLIVDGALYDVRNAVVVPAELGGCPPIESQSSNIESQCSAERASLRVASEAYFAHYGTPPTEVELVNAGLLRTEIENYDVVTSNGVIEIVSVTDQCAPF